MSNLDYFCTSRSGGNEFIHLHHNSAAVLRVWVGFCLLVAVLVWYFFIFKESCCAVAMK